MGVEIAYDISIRTGSDIDSVFRKLKQSAERRGFKVSEGVIKGPACTYLSDMQAQAKFEIIQRGTATNCLRRHKEEWPSEIRALLIGIHPNAETLEVLLGRYSSEWFGFGGVKTQGAPPQAHIDAVAVLDQLQELGATLKVYDDSTYYETRDERRLVAIRDSTNAILAQKMSISRGAASVIEVRMGRQTLTYQAEMEMAQDRWSMNEGKLSHFVVILAASPWEIENAHDEEYVRALTDHGMIWFKLPPDGRVPDDLFARLFDLDPKNKALNDLLFYCLTGHEAGARMFGQVLPTVVWESNGKRDQKALPHQGAWRSDLDVEAAEKVVSELGPEVERWAYGHDAYLTIGGKRSDAIFVCGGERGMRWAVVVAQRYVPKGNGREFQTTGQPVVMGPTSNPMRQDPERALRPPPYIRSEETIAPDGMEATQTIVVDDAHSAMSGAEDPPAYIIKKTKALALDFGSYFFETSKILGKAPNAAHVLSGEAGAYFTKISAGEKSAVLHPDRMERSRGGIFRGFKERGMVAIGWQAPAVDPEGSIQFVPFWIGMYRIEGMEEAPPPQPRPRTSPQGEEELTDMDTGSPADISVVTDTEMRKFNVYFARGTRDHYAPKRTKEAVMRQEATAESVQGAAGVGKEIHLTDDDSLDPVLEEGQVPFSQVEALKWLTRNKNESALASERFHTTQEAIEAVKRLYEAGAVKVEVVATYNEPSRIVQDGGPYADELEVTFPAEGKEKLLAVIKGLEPDNWRMGGLKLEEATAESVGSEPETLWWAGVQNLSRVR